MSATKQETPWTDDEPQRNAKNAYLCYLASSGAGTYCAANRKPHFLAFALHKIEFMHIRAAPIASRWKGRRAGERALRYLRRLAQT